METIELKKCPRCRCRMERSGSMQGRKRVIPIWFCSRCGYREERDG